MTTHGALTIFVKIKPGMVESLRAKLYEINYPAAPYDIETNPIIPFKKISSIHFARFVILEEAKDIKGNTITPSLVFSTNYDKPLNKHLQEMVSVAGPGLREVFNHCEGFSNGEDLLKYLKKNKVGYSAFYKGTPYRSVGRVNREAELRDTIEVFLDTEVKKDKSATPSKLRERIVNFVHSEKKFSWVRTKEDPTFLYYIKHYGSMIIVLPLLAVFALVAGLLAVIPLRIKEKRDLQEKSFIEDDKIRTLVKEEDKIVQNQLTHIVDIKPGWFRLLVLKAVLFSINTLAVYIFNKGKLGSIPTIHFARWVIIDNGRRLLFFSNFDGSWENYLGDFIDKAAVGLTGVWSNTVGFPKAKFLVFEGATDEQRFKSWTRAHQIPTQVWYSAYKLLSVQNINNNSKIRSGLRKSMNEKQTRQWLKRF